MSPITEGCHNMRSGVGPDPDPGRVLTEPDITDPVDLLYRNSGTGRGPRALAGRLRDAERADRRPDGRGPRAPLGARRGMGQQAQRWQPVTEAGFEHENLRCTSGAPFAHTPT